MDKFQCKKDNKGRLNLVNITDIEAREILPTFGLGFELGKIYLESDFKIVKVKYRRYVKGSNLLTQNIAPMNIEFRAINTSMLDIYSNNSLHNTSNENVICIIEY